MKPHGHWNEQGNYFLALDKSDCEDEELEKLEDFAATIEDAKYGKVSTDKVVDNLKHLTEVQKGKQKLMLKKHEKFFLMVD